VTTPAPRVGPGQAVLVLGAYVAAFLAVTGVLVRARDVT
jgi:hypothetical protein